MRAPAKLEGTVNSDLGAPIGRRSGLAERWSVRVSTRRVRWAVVALVVAAAAVGVPGWPAGPASAATTSLTLETTLTKTLGRRPADDRHRAGVVVARHR